MTQDDTKSLDGSEAGDRFGFSLAIDDFDLDGFSDLAIGAPGEDRGNLYDVGAVEILYGSPLGLSAADAQFQIQNTPHTPGVPENENFFGYTLHTQNLG